MVSRVGLNGLRQRKITCSYPYSNPGPSSPFPGFCTGHCNYTTGAMSVGVTATGDKTGAVLGTALSSG